MGRSGRDGYRLPLPSYTHDGPKRVAVSAEIFLHARISAGTATGSNGPAPKGVGTADPEVSDDQPVKAYFGPEVATIYGAATYNRRHRA